MRTPKIDNSSPRVAFSCTRCGAAMGTCDCWTQITLECPQCGRTKKVYRDDTDPPGTARVVAHCDTCPGEDNGLIDYFDAQGRQIGVPDGDIL
jgi:predicted  nucleic acid-binding Zn-ribbon protein